MKKLRNLKVVNFFKKGRSGADDAKLKAFADLGLTKVEGVGLLACSSVTDDGLASLSKIRSLKWMGLEGTSITDAELGIIASNMNLTGLNVANCDKVTPAGLAKLAISKSLADFSFSSGDMTVRGQ